MVETQDYAFTVTTDSDGAGSFTSADLGLPIANGKLVKITWKDGDITSSADITVKNDVDDTKGVQETLFAFTTDGNDKVFYPKVNAHDKADGSAIANEYVVQIVSSGLSVTIADGGDTKTGYLTVTIEQNV